MPANLTPRERVLTTFAHQEPDRVPAWLGASPEFIALALRQLDIADDESLRVYVGDDFRRVYARYAGPLQAEPLFDLQPGATYRTPFGVQRHGYGYGQPLQHPLADATLDEIHGYAWPDPAWMDVSAVLQQALQYNERYAILGGEWSPFWHDAIDLLGMENLVLKMYDQPKVVDALLTHIVDYYVEVSRLTFDTAAKAIDIFFIGNDFGTQVGPIMGEATFRRFMLPHLKRLVDLGHDYGLLVLLHCCGGFAPLLPALIEIGLDGLQALQPACTGMDPETLKSSYGTQITFMGCIDTQHVLIEGTPQLTREQTRQVLEVMKPGGGYIASASHDYLLPETPVENVLAMFEAIREYGAY